MSNIDKQAVQAVADLKAGYILGQADVAILNELTRIALASLEAEAAQEWTNEQCLEFLSIAFRHAEINGDLQFDDIRLGVKMVNGSRADMLQDAEPLTTAYKLPFDKWLSQQNKPLDVDCGCVTTEAFYHWLRVAYEAGNSPVIADGWVACSERMPTPNQYVLVCNGVWVGMGMHNNSEHLEDDERWQDERHEFIDLLHHPVTHWMPLPAAPQQEAE